jgi:hypothetical protein
MVGKTVRKESGVYAPSDRQMSLAQIPEAQARASQKKRAPYCADLECSQLTKSACNAMRRWQGGVLTRSLRLRREDCGIRSFGGDGGVASRGRYRAIGSCLQGRKRGRVHVKPLLRVFALAELGVVVNVGTGWKVSP